MNVVPMEVDSQAHDTQAESRGTKRTADEELLVAENIKKVKTGENPKFDRSLNLILKISKS